MLNRNLSLGLVTGQPYSQIIKNIKKECDAQKYQIERFVRTERTFIANQASLRGYEEAGIKHYQFVARLDSRTSPQCRELNGKVFNVSDAVAGENLPPMHPYCRSTTVAVWDEEENKPLDTNKIAVKTVSASKIKSDFKPIRGINGNAPKLDKNGENRYNNVDDAFSETIIIDGKKLKKKTYIQGTHNSNPKKSEPNVVIDNINSVGHITRNIYDDNGNLIKQIENFNHGVEKGHDFPETGVEGHFHEFYYNDNGKMIGRSKPLPISQVDKETHKDILHETQHKKNN